MDYEREIVLLQRQVKNLRKELRQKGKLWDTTSSPPWKRLYWFLQGYRLWEVGRWYRKTNDLK